MRKPTVTIDPQAYSSTLTRTFSPDHKPGLPSPVPTPKRQQSEPMTLPPPRSFVADVQEALRRKPASQEGESKQAGLEKPKSTKSGETTTKRWAAKLGLRSSTSSNKPDPKAP